MTRWLPLKSALFTFMAVVALALCTRVQGQAWHIVQNDTTLDGSTTLTLSVDTARLYSNFMFCARNPGTGLWTIWRKSLESGKYSPVFTDRYNRLHVRVSTDGKEMIYVRYRTPATGAMRSATLDSAWVCRAPTNGENEQVLFLVPEYNKNAVYDIDWSSDKRKLIYAWGNDQFPNLTRDGDIMEYDLQTGKTTNLTNNWQLWSKNCRYNEDATEVAFSHYANFWHALPTDVFSLSGGNLKQITNSTQYINTLPYCTITDLYKGHYIYRRGLFDDNGLYEKEGERERVLLKEAGLGGVALTNSVYATTGAPNEIIIFTYAGILGRFKVSGIENFDIDKQYNFDINLNEHLNWLGRQNIKIQWSTGEQSSTISVRPQKTTTYVCRVTAGAKTYTDSVRIKVNTAGRPIITRNCLTLITGKAASYQWNKDGVAVSGATDSTYTPEGPGDFTVSVVNVKGVKVSSLPFNISRKTTDSLEALNSGIAIVPDPSTNKVNIKGASAVVSMAVTDENGRVIFKQSPASVWDMSDVPEGTYFVVLYNNNCMAVKKRKLVKR